MTTRTAAPGRHGWRILPALTLLLLAGAARAETVSYTANLATSKGNPVTSVLILESDGVHPVHATVHPAALPGRGVAVLTHEVPFRPTHTLIVGVTRGLADAGGEKTQLIMFLDPAFAAANAGRPFSQAFPGARHDATVVALEAAAAGDVDRLAWFTDVFFAGPAAGAAFGSGGPFVVAEFSSLKVIGQNATDGAWMVTGFTSLPANDPQAQSGKVTAAIGETATGNPGPFDLQLSLSGAGMAALDKTVLNDTGIPWRRFSIELGTGLGESFALSPPGDGLGFLAGENNREETGAFPDVAVEEDRITFSGYLAPGDSARFIVFFTTDTNGTHLVTVRQRATPGAVGAPALPRSGLALLAALLGAGAWIRLTAAKPRDPARR